MEIFSRLRAWFAKTFFSAETEPEEPAPATDGVLPAPARPVRPLELLIVTPADYRDARQAARALEEEKALFLCLGGLEEGTAQRITDFVSGAVYLLHGTIQLYGGGLLLCLPQSVRLKQEDPSFSGSLPTFRGVGP